MRRVFEPIIQVLAFLGVQKDYSYIDRLGNALDEVSILESVRDALRAYHATCGEKEECIEVREGVGIKCPNINWEELEKSINALAAMLSTKSRPEIVRLSRELATKAYATIPRFSSENYLCTPQR